MGEVREGGQAEEEEGKRVMERGKTEKRDEQKRATESKKRLRESGAREGGLLYQ